MNFVDTHCHIQFADYPLDTYDTVREALDAGVTKLICVGCTLEDSRLAIELSNKFSNIWATIGIHPHEAKKYVGDSRKFQAFHALASQNKVVAVGEIGLDYYYNHSDKESQKELLRFQLTVAQENNLPVIFHVRDAFEDFWPIYDEFKPSGIVHSFSAGKKELDQILSRNLLVGLNGIITFSKDSKQLEAVKGIPLENIVLETDAPYLTPVPFRGTICQPKHVATTAAFLSELRGEKLKKFAHVTTNNAERLLNLSL